MTAKIMHIPPLPPVIETASTRFDATLVVDSPGGRHSFLESAVPVQHLTGAHAAAFVVDRENFIAWSHGILMDLRKGRGVAPNEIQCQAVEDAIDRGEKVFLTRNDRIFSVLDPETREETLCEGAQL